MTKAEGTVLNFMLHGLKCKFAMKYCKRGKLVLTVGAFAWGLQVQILLLHSLGTSRIFCLAQLFLPPDEVLKLVCTRLAWPVGLDWYLRG